MRTIITTATRPSMIMRPPITTRTPTKAKTISNNVAKTTHMPIDIAITTPKQQENKTEKQMKLQALHNVQPGPINSKVQSIANPPEEISPVHIRSKVKLHKIEDDDKKREIQPELTESKLLSNRILKILLRRDIPIESTNPLNRPDIPSQENANLNSRLQFMSNEADVKAEKILVTCGKKFATSTTNILILCAAF